MHKCKQNTALAATAAHIDNAHTRTYENNHTNTHARTHGNKRKNMHECTHGNNHTYTHARTNSTCDNAHTLVALLLLCALL